MTIDRLKEALDCLNRERLGLLNRLASITPDELYRKPGPHRWSLVHYEIIRTLSDKLDRFRSVLRLDCVVAPTFNDCFEHFQMTEIVIYNQYVKYIFIAHSFLNSYSSLGCQLKKWCLARERYGPLHSRCELRLFYKQSPNLTQCP